MKGYISQLYSKMFDYKECNGSGRRTSWAQL